MAIPCLRFVPWRSTNASSLSKLIEVNRTHTGWSRVPETLAEPVDASLDAGATVAWNLLGPREDACASSSSLLSRACRSGFSRALGALKRQAGAEGRPRRPPGSLGGSGPRGVPGQVGARGDRLAAVASDWVLSRAGRSWSAGRRGCRYPSPGSAGTVVRAPPGGPVCPAITGAVVRPTR